MNTKSKNVIKSMTMAEFLAANQVGDCPICGAHAGTSEGEGIRCRACGSFVPSRELWNRSEIARLRADEAEEHEAEVEALKHTIGVAIDEVRALKETVFVGLLEDLVIECDLKKTDIAQPVKIFGETVDTIIEALEA